MPTVDIVINATGKPAGVASVAREFTYADLVAAPTVTLSIDDATGVTSYAWELLDIPPTSAAVLSSATAAAPTFLPDLPGTYLIQCTVNSGEAYNKNGVSYSTEKRALRKPSAGETTEFDTDGWAKELNEIIDTLDDVTVSEYVGALNEVGVSGSEVAIGGFEFDPSIHPSDMTMRLEWIGMVTDPATTSVGQVRIYDYGPVAGPPVAPVLRARGEISSVTDSGVMLRIQTTLTPDPAPSVEGEIYDSARIYQVRADLTASGGGESMNIYKSWVSVK